MACGLLCSWGVQAPEQVDPVVAVRGLSSCGTWAPEHVGLVAPQHVGS